MFFNLAAFAAFLMLSQVKGCKTSSYVIALVLAAQVATSYNAINAVTPNVIIPVEIVELILISYFFVSMTGQLYIIKSLRFSTNQFCFVSSMSVFAVINDIVGLWMYWNWIDLAGYNQRSMIIIALQFAATWTLRRGRICLFHADTVRRMGRAGDSRND